MIDIKMYFSNICILGRMETLALNSLIEKVKEYDINLDVQHFGLGQKYYMNQYFKHEPTLPDIIISTDLELFENNAVFNGLPEDFISLTPHFKTKRTMPKNVLWSDKLLPFLIIPMVFFHNDFNIFKGLSPSLENVIKHTIPITFGGINNSGAKCILKTVHDKYGLAACEKLAQNAVVTKMPIEAFNRVRKGESSLAMVPSVYAMRADKSKFFLTYPADGAVALPSYIAVKKDKAEHAVKVLKTLFTAEFCNQFIIQGALYCGLNDTPDPTLLADNSFSLSYPSTSYITTSQPDFYHIYEQYIQRPV
jgi:hypothetical protein